MDKKCKKCQCLDCRFKDFYFEEISNTYNNENEVFHEFLKFEHLVECGECCDIHDIIICSDQDCQKLVCPENDGNCEQCQKRFCDQHLTDDEEKDSFFCLQCRKPFKLIISWQSGGRSGDTITFVGKSLDEVKKDFYDFINHDFTNLWSWYGCEILCFYKDKTVDLNDKILLYLKDFCVVKVKDEKSFYYHPETNQQITSKVINNLVNSFTHWFKPGKQTYRCKKVVENRIYLANSSEKLEELITENYQFPEVKESKETTELSEETIQKFKDMSPYMSFKNQEKYEQSGLENQMMVVQVDWSQVEKSLNEN